MERLKYRLGEMTLKVIHDKLYSLNEATNWCCDVVDIFTAQLHPAKSAFREVCTHVVGGLKPFSEV